MHRYCVAELQYEYYRGNQNYMGSTQGSCVSKPTRRARGFTLIEILIVIGIIAILAAIVVVAINPARQFAQARNSQRVSNVNALLNAVGENISDNSGIFSCASALPSSATYVGSGTGEANIYACIVPTYMPEMPADPGNTDVFTTFSPHVTSASDYETGYQISQTSGGRVTVCAPGGIEGAIAGSKAICVTR